MRSLIHLGFPKTATTSLQKHIFQRLGLSSYLGKYIQIGVLSKYSSLLTDWHLGKVSNFLDSQVNPFFISEEKLLASSLVPRSHGFLNPARAVPLIDVLRAIRKSLTVPDNVDFILTIRPQDQLIHSFYSQIYSRVFRRDPSLSNFDSYIKFILKNPLSSHAQFYDFEATVNSITQIFPNSIIHVLPYESYLESTSIITNLLASYGFEFDSPVPSTLPSSNKRSVSSDIKSAANATYLPFTHYIVYRLLFSRLLRDFSPLSSYRNYLQSLTYSYSPSFELKSSHSSAIMDFYRESNINLSARFNLNLGQSYYC